MTHGDGSAHPVASLDARRVTLGGSTIAAACGVDPWCSPIRLWCELTGRLQREPSEAMQWGTRLEPLILEAVADRYHTVTTAREQRSDAYPWLIGHPDGLAFRSPSELGLIVEAKASARGYDSPPLHYLAQVQTYMFLGERREAVIATLSGLRLQVAEVERSDHQIELLLHLAERFMRYVWDDVQPPPEGHPDDRGALVQLFPDAEPRTVRETREIRDARRELVALTEAHNARKARMETLRASLTSFMGSADTLLDSHDQVVATWKNTTTRRLDVAGLKRDAPDVYARYAVPQTTRRLLT